MTDLMPERTAPSESEAIPEDPNTPLRGVALLQATLLHIQSFPEKWYQGDYRCSSGLCAAGTAGVLAGGRWVNSNPRGEANGFMVAEEDDDPDFVTTRNGQPMIHVGNRARRVLGLGFYQSLELFSGGNTLEDLEGYVLEYTERGTIAGVKSDDLRESMVDE